MAVEWSVTTTKGLLEKRTDEDDNDNERMAAVEYWLDGELIHRSAHVHIKKGLSAFGETAAIGG